MIRSIFSLVWQCFIVSSIFAHKDPAPQYIAQYSAIAQQEMARSGIPASIKLAQALLESESGRSPLAKDGNNHFGIKCGKEWQGKTYFKLDDDADGEGKIIESCFRAFDTPEESFIAHSDFLTDPRKSHRYGVLFTYSTRDYKSWAIGLREAGYASDPTYPDKLIRIIEKYNLSKLDESVSTIPSLIVQKEIKKTITKKTEEYVKHECPKKEEKPAEHRTTRLKTIQAIPDLKNIAFKIEIVNHQKAIIIPQLLSVEKIATVLHMKPTELIAYNEMLYAPDQIVEEGSYIFLNLKSKDYKGKLETHVVAQGETIESIANLYGIRANTIYALNRIPKGNQPLVKEVINLKYKIEKNKKPKTSLVQKQAKLLFSMASN